MERDTRNKLFEFIIFMSVLNIPFIIMASSMGLETFLDSFENPQSYDFYTNFNLQGTTTHENLIIQKAHHPDFSLNHGDAILYYEGTTGFQCGTIDLVSTNCQQKIFYLSSDNDPYAYHPVFEEQVVGKILHNINNDPLSSLCLELWHTATSRLNLLQLFSPQ